MLWILLKIFLILLAIFALFIFALGEIGNIFMKKR